MDPLSELERTLLNALKALREPSKRGWKVIDWALRYADADAAIAKAEEQSK